MQSSSDAPDVLVVGSGPNGLAAAVVCARAGLSVQVREAQPTLGGGARTEPGPVPGIVHDVCSAVHPLALASPFLRAVDLPARGVELRAPEASYAHVVDARRTAIAWRDIERTAAGLGSDGRAWSRMLGPLAEDAGTVAALALGDKRSLPAEALAPRGLGTAVRLGTAIGMQGTRAWDAPFRTEAARALLAGVAAHAITPLPSLAAGGTALLLATLAHAEGWPIPVGGSRAITDALLADLHAHGGVVTTSDPVDSLPRPGAPGSPRAAVLDTSADEALRLLADRLPSHAARGLRRLGHGGAAAKVDLVLSGPIPWADPAVAHAGTVHLGGTRTEMAAAERAVLRGRLPDRPMILFSDPVVADPSREVDGLRPIWAYAHVPLDCPLDPVELVLERIEEAAPGTRDLVVAARGIPAAGMHEHNASLIGGDIAQGTVTMARMLARPRAARDPWHLADGAYLCSGAAIPGPGVHGMGGWFAARSLLRREFGILQMPGVGPRR